MDFDQAIADSDRTLIAFAGKEVVFRRGEVAIPWRALMGSTKFETTDTNGCLTTFESQDFHR